MRLPASLAAALALSLGACTETTPESLPPLDRFYFPIGVATSRLAGGTALLVASSNYDLRYTGTDGGTFLSVDPAAPTAPDGRIVPIGAERIGSYAGRVAVADASTCSVGGPAAAIVASRFDDRVYQFGIGAGGELACGAGCTRSAPHGFDDPFAVAVACGGGARRAFVGYLDPPNSSRGTGVGGWVSEIDLDDPAAPAREIELGDGPIRGLAYDAAGDRLWATTQSSGARALLHSVVLSDPRWSGATPWEAVDTLDLFPYVHGAELRAIAVGTAPAPGTARLFLTARLYDAEAQATSGVRPVGDVGGVLIVLDVVAGVDGRPAFSIRAVEQLGLGVEEVAVVKRASGADLVVATSAGEGLLFLYDDESGSMLRVVGRNDLGSPIVGDRPMAIAVDQPSAGADADVYVTAFGSHAVRSFVLKPGDPSAALLDPENDLKRIGGLAP